MYAKHKPIITQLLTCYAPCLQTPAIFFGYPRMWQSVARMDVFF